MLYILNWDLMQLTKPGKFKLNQTSETNSNPAY